MLCVTAFSRWKLLLWACRTAAGAIAWQWFVVASELCELLLHHTAPGQAFPDSGCVMVRFSFRDELQGLVSG